MGAVDDGEAWTAEMGAVDDGEAWAAFWPWAFSGVRLFLGD